MTNEKKKLSDFWLKLKNSWRFKIEMDCDYY